VNWPVFPVNGQFYPLREITKIGNSLRTKEWKFLLVCNLGIFLVLEKSGRLENRN